MSITSSWLKSLHRDVISFLLSNNLGPAWETEREETEDKISIFIPAASFTERSKDNYHCEFTVRLVCTISTLGLYDLSDISGAAALLLTKPLPILGGCAISSKEKIEIKLFDWAHGYKQSRMEQNYSIDLRG